MDAVLLLFFGYIFGSIPFGLVLTKMAGLGDVRAIGSGNIGATNVLRTGRKGLAAATLLLDALKGAAPVLLAPLMFDHSPVNWASIGAIAGVGAFLGHVFPIWLKFKGGKGVATGLGVIFALSWPVGLIVAGLWLAVASLFRISSLAALVASGGAPLLMAILGPDGTWLPLVFMVTLIFWAHRANMKRLLAGTEPKIGAK